LASHRPHPQQEAPHRRGTLHRRPNQDSRQRSRAAILRHKPVTRQYSQVIHQSNRDTRRNNPDIHQFRPVTRRRSQAILQYSRDTRSSLDTHRKVTPQRSPVTRRRSQVILQRNQVIRLRATHRNSLATLRRSPGTRLRNLDTRRRSPVTLVTRRSSMLLVIRRSRVPTEFLFQFASNSTIIYLRHQWPKKHERKSLFFQFFPSL
jgi:hypothetical protein